MKIIQKAIHIIDYENSSVIARDIPAEFESYVTDLINHISCLLYTSPSPRDRG